MGAIMIAGCVSIRLALWLIELIRHWYLVSKNCCILIDQGLVLEQSTSALALPLKGNVTAEVSANSALEMSVFPVSRLTQP